MPRALITAGRMVAAAVVSPWIPKVVLWLVVLMVVVIALTLKPPLTLLAVSLKTEIVNLYVTRMDAARMVLPVARHMGEDACYRDVVLRPDLRSTVTYARGRGEALVVSVKGNASWDGENRFKEATNRAKDDSPQFEVGTKNEDCKLDKVTRVRLPISGIAEFGSPLLPVVDATSDQLTLLSGKMVMYGRAISTIAGLMLDRSPFQPDTLYLSQELQVPGGTRIVTADVEFTSVGSASNVGAPGPGTDDDLLSRWQGYADLSFSGDDQGAMDVEATTSARRVKLYSPAGGRGTAGQEPDIVSLSLGAQLTGDPNLRWIAGLIAVVVSLIALSELFERPESRKEISLCPTLPPPAAEAGPAPSASVLRPRFRPLRPHRPSSLSMAGRKGRASRSH